MANLRAQGPPDLKEGGTSDASVSKGYCCATAQRYNFKILTAFFS
jgi:hypothetical protein